ncbi:MAG: baseplate J/gp47 family protein [Candidatus Methanoperedens sp.]|nr:baseplate J/gp47 family protein [Candidatus Methanoperedens sp.]
MASDLPTPQSYEQLVSDMLSAYAAKLGINDFNVGSANTSFFEVVALVAARSSGDVFQILRDFSVDRATGDALKRLAQEEGVTPITAKPATGSVSVTDTSFTKIFTKIYSGSNPPNIGSTSIKVSDASAFPGTGSIYIGRGTPNVEGPLPYTSITPSGGFFIIALSSPTTKFHNLGETVILAQGGNRPVPINAIVFSPGIGSNIDIQYTVTTAAVILDGETRVDNVQVSALTPGASGNVPAGSIKSFASSPFSGAAVTNPLPFTTGADSETDDQLRVRIKRAKASSGLGTATAVKSALIGATPSDEQATIVSDSLQTNTDGSATVFIDDGTGYEAKSAGVGLESIVDSALGGEKFFALQTGGRQAPVAKAFLQTTLFAPFDLIGGDTLAVVVGGVTYQHTFATDDFRSPGGATAFEVTASINADTALGFEATTAGGGMFIVIRAKAETNDEIMVTVPSGPGRDASVQVGFPSNTIETLRLYKNNVPLSKDGSTASVFSQTQQLWSPTIANGDTLILSVDGTDAITYTITDGDFIATNLYTSVASTNSLASWAQVFNAKLTGVTVTVVGQQLEVTSNLGASNRAQVVIDGASTLVSKGMFVSVIGLSSQGKASDFMLDRNTAQFELVEPLVAGDKLSAGTSQTQATISSNQIPSGVVTMSADAHLWLLIDNSGSLIPTGVGPNTNLAVSKPSTNIIRYTSSVSGAFSNVQTGDYAIIWSEELDPNNRLEGRVQAVTSTTLDLLVTASEYAAAVVQPAFLFLDGFVVLRSTLSPQKFRVQSGSKTLDQISQELQAQTQSLVFSVIQEQFLSASTETLDLTGSLMVVTADGQGKLLSFNNGDISTSKDSLLAFYDSGDEEGQLPSFLHALFAAGSAADPIDSFISSFTSSVSLSGRDPNELVGMLHPYGAVRDAQPYGEFVQETSIAGATIGITLNPDVRRLRVTDRYFLANPLDFGSADTAVVVLDNDASNKSFEIPFYRRAVTNTSVVSNPNNFNAYDVDSGVTANFVSAFGDFDFSNFKVWMRAKKVLKPTPSQTAILYRATKWGRSGEKINVAYVYPPVANSPISSTVEVGSTVPIRINLASGAPVTNFIDASTQWDITVTPNTPSAGIDQVTYTWNGIGTNPNMSLSGGEYVNITTQTEFDPANDGTFRVSTEVGFTPTATAFSVQRPNGVAVAETNKGTGVNGAITLYNNSPTTAAQIQAYVAANLSNYFSATLVNDGGTSGAGVIVLSTFEDSGFTYESVSLLDGINWLASSNLSGSPQFVFKNPLSLPTDVGYAFNNGEEVRIIPTTPDQVRRFISILAVTGFTTLGNVEVVDRAMRLMLTTQILGSSGAIQVIGGLGNEYEVPILDSAARLDNTYMTVSVDRVSSQGVHSDQWFRLQASMSQKKITQFSSNSSVSIVGNTPTTGQSTITLAGRTLTQRYLGKPRHHVRTRGRNFRVEKQGSLVCVSWDGVGSSPAFLKSSLNFNDSGGGTLNVAKVLNSSDSQYVLLTGVANFTELSIGDLFTVAGMTSPENNGTFLVTGVSDNGRIVQVLNPDAVNAFSHSTFTFSGNLTNGDQFTIGATTLTAVSPGPAGPNQFLIGGSQAASEANFAATVGTLAGFSATVSGNDVIVTSTAAAAEGGPAIPTSYSGSAVVTVDNANLTGDSFSAGDFTASSEVSEGDTVTFDAPFSVLNRGRFRVIRRYNDSIWIENSNVIEEEVTLPYNSISLGFDATTSFKVNATNHTAYLNWNGVGTEPTLENANVGDVVTFGTDFNAANRGDFMVIRSGVKLQQISNLTVPTGAQFTIGGAGKYFLINGAGNVSKYYVWFDVNGSNSDPGPIVGRTGITVPILSGDNAATVASKLATAINTGAPGVLTATFSGAVTTVTTVDFIETDDPANFNVPSPFSVQVSQEGRRTFLECINPLAVNDSTVLVSGGVLQCHRPQMQFWEYDATVAGDLFTIAGTILGANNAGTYTVIQVLDKDHLVIGTNLANATNVSLNGNETAVYVQEGVPYSGYKKVFLSAAQPGAPLRNELLFDTNNQYEKINESAGVQMTSLGKLNFSTVLRNGLDSYRYNTGLIAEANRIVYGDPRDPVTYPGVGAAGADIFIREPLDKRIQVSVDIRLLTGAPFNTVSQQVRSSVAALINSNDVGVSIDISSIISAARAVPGVQSVAIDSPQFDSTHDLIFLAPGEKARIIDPTLDISVNQIGN